MTFFRKKCYLIFALLGALWGNTAFGASLQVDPLGIELSQQQRVQSITLSNFDNEPLIIQATLAKWTQNKAGKDNLQPSNDLLLSPPIVTIPTGGQRIIRIGFMAAAFPPKTEAAYRLYLQEIQNKETQEATQTSQDMLFVALRVSLPVFVKPLQKTPTLLNWQANSVSGKTQLTLTNNGQAHTKVLNINIRDAKGKTYDWDTFSYVLPGSTHTWTVPSKTQFTLPVTLIMTTDEGIAPSVSVG